MMSNFAQELAQIKYLEPKRKIALFTLLLILFVGGFTLGVFFFRGKQIPLSTPTIKPSPTPRPTATLRLSPSAATLKVGERVKVNLVLEKLSAEAVDVVLTYNPAQLTISNLTRGKAFSDYHVLKGANGKILISTSVNANKPTPPSLPVTIASFSITGPKATDSAIIDFDPVQTIVAREGENVLGLMVGGRYQIK